MNMTRDERKGVGLLQRHNPLGGRAHSFVRLNSSYKALIKKLTSLKEQVESFPAEKHKSHEAQLAEVIIENSRAILFRRLAASDPAKRKMVYVSPNISRFGYKAEDFITGHTMYRDLIYPGDSERTLQEIDEFVRQGIERYSQIYRIVTRKGDVRWVEDRTSIFEDQSSGLRYYQGIVIDINDQKVTEEKLRKSEEKYRRIVETAGEGFLLMDEAFNVIDHNSAYAEILGYPGKDLTSHPPLGIDPHKFLQLFSTDNSGVENPDRRKIEFELSLSDGRIVPLLIHANSLLTDNGEIIGNMAFITDISTQKKALQLAAEVQKGLLPDSAPTTKGLDIAGKSFPCDEVGGDYFDYLFNSSENDERLSIVIGDIMGHGVDSALLMTSARAFLRMRASQTGAIADIVKDMNQQLTGDMAKSGRFMTLLLLHFGEGGRSVEWVRAGHDPGLLYDLETNQFWVLRGPGLALGIDPDYNFQSQKIDTLKPGQILILTTDGINEGCNHEQEMYGQDRLKNIVRDNAGENAEKILHCIVSDHSRFTGGIAKEDDATLVVVKVV